MSFEVRVGEVEKGRDEIEVIGEVERGQNKETEIEDETFFQFIFAQISSRHTK